MTNSKLSLICSTMKGCISVVTFWIFPLNIIENQFKFWKVTSHSCIVKGCHTHWVWRVLDLLQILILNSLFVKPLIVDEKFSCPGNLLGLYKIFVRQFLKNLVTNVRKLPKHFLHDWLLFWYWRSHLNSEEVLKF